MQLEVPVQEFLPGITRGPDLELVLIHLHNYTPSGDGSGYFSADGSWSYYQDYKEEMDNYVIDEWTERVSQFHAEFLKNPRSEAC